MLVYLISKFRQRLTVEQALNHEWFKKWEIKAKIAELEKEQALNATSSIETTTKCVTKINNKNETVEIKATTNDVSSLITVIDNNVQQQNATSSTITTSNSTYALQLQQIHYHTLHLYNHVLNEVVVDDKTIKSEYLNEKTSIATAAL